jgi:hypothetical protein
MHQLRFVPLFHRLFHVLTTYFGRFSDYRQWPDNEWCWRIADGYTCSDKLFKRAEIKFVLVLTGEPPCGRWLIHLLGCGIWHNLGVRISLRQGQKAWNRSFLEEVNVLSYVQCCDSLPFIVCGPRFCMVPGRERLIPLSL